MTAIDAAFSSIVIRNAMPVIRHGACQTMARPNGHAQVFDGKGVYRSMGSGMCGRHEAQVTK
jgi:hypothetical protein